MIQSGPEGALGWPGFRNGEGSPMPSYSNRHHYQEPMHLGSGDFEAGSYNQNYPQIPPAPRMPALSERHASHHGGHQFAQTGPHRPVSGSHFPPPASTNRRGIPAAPHSLAPVAMGTARAAHVTQDAMEAPARPSAKAGMSILFAGAIIGGLIGAVMHARQNAADAFAVASQQNTHEVAPDSTGPAPTPTPSLGGTVIPPINDGEGGKDKLADHKKDDDAKKDTTKKQAGHKWAWKGPSKGTTTGANAPVQASGDDDDDVTPVKTTTAKGKKASNKDDDGYTIASAGGDDGGDATPPAKTKTTDVTKSTDTKAAATDTKKKADKAPAADPTPPKKSSGKSDDAVNVLKAAMGATENSL